jgi:hypothetical protein
MARRLARAARNVIDWTLDALERLGDAIASWTLPPRRTPPRLFETCTVLELGKAEQAPGAVLDVDPRPLGAAERRVGQDREVRVEPRQFPPGLVQSSPAA